MNRKRTYFPSPAGTKNTPLNNAEIAEDKTSIELVGSDSFDAFFFRSLEKDGVYLNYPQIEAVRHFHGPALILAGAGSGKTRVLTARTAYLVKVQQVHPKNIMLVTFSKKAADEMTDRLHSFSGLSPHEVRGITTGTFHSIFWRLLRSRGFTQKVLSNERQKQIAVKLLLKKNGLQDTYEPETLLAILSSFKNKKYTIHDLPDGTVVEKEIKSILLQYEQWKQDQGYIDFDDMLLASYQLLLSDPNLLKMMQKRFQFILCDEWQDTNPLQFELIQMIARPDNHLFVVGDDDQTIYTFNGADSSIILNFEKFYPEACKIKLDINYRSTASIIGLANHVIRFNQQRHEKILKATKKSEVTPWYSRPSTTEEEAKQVIDQIKILIDSGDKQYSDFAVLHRTLSNSRALFDQFVLNDIPFISYTRGKTFYEQSLVHPLLDYLKLSLDPTNLGAIEGILPTLYINREKGLNHIFAEQILSPDSMPLETLLSLPYLKAFQKTQITERVGMIKSLKEMKPKAAIKKVRKFYDAYLEANERKNVTLYKEMIVETLDEVEASAEKFNTVAEYLQFTEEVIAKSKQMDALKKEPHANAVRLMTIHHSKGLEFPVVFLIGASESILPHSSSLEAKDRKDLILPSKGFKKVNAAIEEERRLAYVAVTRAKEALYISSPAFYRGQPTSVSRFFSDPYSTSESVGEGMTKELVWNCTEDTCIGWMRITTPEEKEHSERECPICKGVMKQDYQSIPLPKPKEHDKSR